LGNPEVGKNGRIVLDHGCDNADALPIALETVGKDLHNILGKSSLHGEQQGQTNDQASHHASMKMLCQGGCRPMRQG
jgi:hypothetical protein